MTPSPANDTGKVDGRVLRGERTRARIVDALINLIREGSLVPRAVDIAGRADLTMLERTVNGQPGLVIQEQGVTVTVMAFDVADDRISHIWAVRNPEKLRPWTTG